MKIKIRYLNIIAVALIVVILITSGLILLDRWEAKRGQFADSGVQDGVVTYQGQEYILKNNLETFLMLGLDRYEDSSSADSHESGVQTDFLMLFVFDNNTKTCEAVHINRDTMTKVNRLSIGGSAVVDTQIRQIALAYNYVESDNDKIKCRNTVDSVEALLHGVDVQHYLSLTMDAVPAMNDLVGGVEVTVLDDFTGIDETLVKGETVTLKGEQALRYVRSRQGLEDSTNSTRMKRQQQYINALYAKTASCMEADDAFIVEWVQKMDEYIVYDSSNQKMQKFAEKFEEYDFLGIQEIKGEVKVGEYAEFYPNEDALWEMVIQLFYTPQK